MARQPGSRTMTMDERLQQGLESGGLTLADAGHVRAFGEFLKAVGHAKEVEHVDRPRGRMMRAQAIVDYYTEDGDPELLAVMWKQRHVTLHYATMLIALGHAVPESGTDRHGI